MVRLAKTFAVILACIGCPALVVGIINLARYVVMGMQGFAPQVAAYEGAKMPDLAGASAAFLLGVFCISMALVLGLLARQQAK